MNTYQENFDKLQEAIKRDVPKFELKRKEDSRLMRILAKLLFFVKFERFTTTIYPVVYLADKRFKNLKKGFRTLAHEWVHLHNAKGRNIRFSLGYLFPQFLAVFSLLSLLAIWLSNWWLLALCFLVCAAPLPAPFRAREEMEAYAMSMFVSYHQDGQITLGEIRYIVKHFTGSNYYFMRPGKKRVTRWINDIAESIENGEYDDKPLFREVKAILKPGI